MKKEIAGDSSATEVYLRLAEYYNYSHALSAGREYFSGAIDENPTNGNLYLGLAVIHSHLNDWQQAFDHCELALARGSAAVEAVNLLILSALQLNNTDRLPQILGKLRRQTGQEHLYDLGYAIWRFRIENLKRARSTITDFLKTNPEHADGLKILADINQAMGNFRPSLQNYLSVLEWVDEKKVNLRLEALRGVAVNYAKLGVPDSSEIYLQQSEQLAQEVGALAELIEIREFASDFYEQQERYSEMAEASAEVIAILEKLDDRERLSGSYYSLAFGYEQMGDAFRALKFYFEALEKATGKDMEELQAKIHAGIGRSFQVLGRWQLAGEHLDRSADLASKIGQVEAEHEALLNLGDIYHAKGDVEKARAAYQQVLSFAQSIQRHDLTEICFVKLANLYLDPPTDLNHATYYLDMADALARQTFQLQFAANHRWMQGKIALLENDIERSETYFSHAIQLGKESGSYLSILAGQAGLIRTYLRANFIDLAAVQADTALDYLLNHFSLIKDEFTWQFFDLKDEFIIPAATAYTKLGNPSKIYQLCEHYKAIDQIVHSAHLKYKITQPLADSINSRIEFTNNQINQKWENLWDAWKRDKSDNLDVVMKLKEEINELQTKQRAEFSNMAQTYPEYYGLFQPHTQPLLEIGDALQKSNTTLIDYLVGENATFVLVIRDQSIYSKQIDIGNAELRKLIDQVSPVFTSGYFGRSRQNNVRVPAFRVDAAAEIYDLIFAPIASWIPEHSRLIISTDGDLNRLPFECLVTNAGALKHAQDYEHAHYLIEDYAISYIPNANFLNFPSNRNNHPTRGFLAAVNSKLILPDNLYTIFNQSRNGQFNGKALDVKESSEQEMEQLKNALSVPKSDIYTEGDIDKKQFIDKCSEYQIIHLALPGYLEDNAPLFAKFFFSEKYDNDDFLETYQLFNLDLNADLVSISSAAIVPANANSGAALKALLNGFCFAGVRSMLTDLWASNSNSIYSHFYASLKEGLDKPEALRKAKLHALRKGQRNPYFWAGLILSGDPSSVEFKSSHLSYIIATTLLGLVILFALVIWHFLKIRGEEN